MKLKPGYKQTEVGVIPEEWKILPLRRACTLLNGRAYALVEWETAGVPVIRLQNLTGGDEYYYSTLELPEQKYCNRGDLLYMWSATFGPRIWMGDKAIYHYHIWKVITHDSETTQQFLYYKLAEITDDKKTRAANGGTMLHVTKSSMESTPIALPPLPEQRAIAAALSDVDALLAALDALIAKKRLVKQGAMQELLTGKRRLPGFSGEWRKCTLSDIGNFSKGRGIKKDDVAQDGLPCIRYGEIYTHYNDYIRSFVSFIPILIAKQSQRILKGDLLFTGSGETAEGIGKCVAFLGDEEAYAGGDIVIFRPVGQDSMFLGYLMNDSSISIQKARMAQGDAIVHISSQKLGQLQLQLPKIQEQHAIAAILSDMDAEITSLEQRREKTRLLKQGMMQELLTGRIRLNQDLRD